MSTENLPDDIKKEQRLVRLTTNKAATWFIRRIASRLDPLLFKATNGRLTVFGPPQLPMLTLTAIGRKSGKPRSVHLVCVEDGDDYLVVASAMGQEKHPGWRYNIEAEPQVQVQISGRKYEALASVLTEDEKDSVWEKIRAAIPQMRVYEKRTDRSIRVFRLSEVKKP